MEQKEPFEPFEQFEQEMLEPARKEDEQPPEKNGFFSEVISWVMTIGLALVLALFITKFIIVNATVPTGSMESTIMPKDRILALRLSYTWSEPERGDVVVFEFPDSPEDEAILYVKRIIGLPGETVEVRDGTVYINGEDISEPYLTETPFGNYGPYEVPEGNYFMMGDNRKDSFDARFWEDKFVAEDEILGKVMLRYYPSPKLIS